MTHKADSSFFDVKREWSKRKDLVLGHYLTPYLSKIARVKRPVLIVDGFAGRGKFRDGNPGSPLLIAEVVREVRQTSPGTAFSILCVERSDEIIDDLRGFVGNEATVVHGRFQDQISEVAARAKNESVFLYLDPYTSTGLHLADLERVFAALRNGMSVEVLMNFNGAAIARHGASVLGVTVEPEVDKDLANESVKTESIDAVLGGSWWQAIIRADVAFADKVARITDGYCRRLSEFFAEVLVHTVFEKSTHALPKYTLVFGSRHEDSLELMNDAMAKSRAMLADKEMPSEPTLFETRSESLVPDVSRLPETVLQIIGTRRMSRKSLMNAIVRDHLGKYLWKDIRGAIQSLLETGRLLSETGKFRINDTVVIWAARSK